MIKRIVIFGMVLFGFVLLTPLLDQYVAKLAYNETTRSFYGETHFWCQAIYRFVPFITASIISIMLMRIIGVKLFKLNAISRKNALIILLCLALGPGLMVNYIFKNHWGRPRPYQVLRDGQTYRAVWQPQFNMPNNNSFPSGHASIGFFLGVPFLVALKRKKAIIIGSAAGMFIGLVRILQGGHYLSDVVLCGVLIYIVSELIIYMVNRIDWPRKE
ncbi:MAG: phosphatase PAP2 family protein [Burkholderiales bacterium]|nr:phosphatase PAP2 family protein [Burkholderiales bacterium]